MVAKFSTTLNPNPPFHKPQTWKNHVSTFSLPPQKKKNKRKKETNKKT